MRGARVAGIQYGQIWDRPIDEFRQTVLPFVDVTADHRTDLALFPRLVYPQLRSIENAGVPPSEAIDRITRYEPELTELFSNAAMKYIINSIVRELRAKRPSRTLRNLRDGPRDPYAVQWHSRR